MKLSSSLLSADFALLLDEAQSVEGSVDRFHWDVMDGHFVPNLTFGPLVVNALRDKLRIPFDIHLMIDRPAIYAPQFRVRPGDTILFHIESEDAPEDILAAIANTEASAGITLRPGTPLDAIVPYLDQVNMILVMSVEPGFGGQAFIPEALDRIRELRELIGTRKIEISVDGGVKVETIHSVVEAGADIVVAGSAVFGATDRVAAIDKLRRAAE
ncbi:ribulose-phosphate 3-epimerase [Candidatus Bipolaricaulota bacterium]